jgi:hypothetical protein
MNPELKAWIEAICNSATTGEQPVSRRRLLFAFRAHVVDDVDSKGGEWLGRRNDETGEYTPRRREAIGHHGLA